MRFWLRVCVLVLSWWEAGAQAQPVTLRLATIAPRGTSWARELDAFARDVAIATHDAVRIKLYLGAIAGSEGEVLGRIHRDQLDGVASGGPLCERLSPTMRALRVLGLTTGRREAAHVQRELRPTIDAEMARSGFVMLGSAPVGPHVLFTRTPVRQLGDLHALKLWVWEHDDVMRRELPAFGATILPLPLEEAARAYDTQRIDGFVAPPTVALAFQWSAQARYALPLPLDSISACLVVTARAWDELSNEARVAVRGASAALASRFVEVGAREDAALLGGLFAQQGLQVVPVGEPLRLAFLTQARLVRERLGASLVEPPLLQRILGLLADYRAEHPHRSGD